MWKGHDRLVRSAAFSPDGSHVVTASDDGTARVWEVARAKFVELKGHGGPVKAAAFDRDGIRVVTASDDGTARIWEAATGREVARPWVGLGGLYSAAFSRTAPAL